jgi:uncharacterized protein YjbI with pentapeptide repeats
LPDPMIVAASKALGKLVYAGVWAWRARHPGVGEEEMHALSALVDAVSSAQALKAARPRPDPTLARAHAELVVASFGEAFRRHWAGDRRLAPLSGDSPRAKEVETAIERALDALLTPGDQPGAAQLGLLDAHADDPLTTPLYRALWRSFSAAPEAGEEPLLVLEGEGRRQFERHFLLAWWEGLASSRGVAIRRWLADLSGDRRRLVRDLLQAHVAGGKGRHVFGDAANGSGPELPLEALYVEPAVTEAAPPEESEDDGTVWTDEETEDVPARAALDVLSELVEAHRVVVVVAPMGYGKSLTARMLAARLAEAWLTAEEPSPEVPLAVPLRAVDLGGRADLRGAVRRAMQRQARAAGVDLRADDPALQPPDDEQRAVFLLDGLDEVPLGPRELDQLLSGVDELASAKHRWILFSRPGALPPAERLAPWPIVELAAFDEPRVADWLDRWSTWTRRAPALSLQELADRGLDAEVRVPLLLFLVASTWEALPRDPHVGDVYEAFFQRVARGKHERDEAAHPVVAGAARTLRDALVERSDLAPAASPVEAMLWLMGRAAWEGRRLAPDRPLTARDVDRIVEDELRLREGAEVTRAVRVGLLLALQADLGGDAERVLFGHRSFEEFLVARYWDDRLRAVVRSRERDWATREEDLLGGRLLLGRTLDLLVARLARWAPADREVLVRWAEDTVNDERLDASELRADRRSALREAVLAVGSLALGSPGLSLRDPTVLRSMLAWFFATGTRVHLVANGMRAPGADLQGVRAGEAQLSRSDLTGASLVGAWMPRASMSAARLVGADLYEADLSGSDLEDADLRGATLAGANLSGALLLSARMADVDATRARFEDADLTDADLHGAVLEDAILDQARLDGARLDGAVLVHASLRGASLRGASLRDADLSGADLSGADLSGADLTDAELP